MNCFQIIKSILDEKYAQIPGNEVEKDEQINEKLQKLRQGYTQLLTGHNISYNNHITRFAYIYAYVTSHANLVCTLIEKNSELNSIFDKEKVKVACIGGGPGSDFLGILKYLMTNQKKPDIKFQICDREKAWAESWSDVDDKVERTFNTSTSYLPLDVTNSNDWKNHKKYFQSDLFTMIYFMSELVALRDLANQYFVNLFSQAKSGSLFLFVDNNNPEFYDWFDKLAKTHNIDIIKSQEDRITVPFEEEKSDLGKYYVKFDSPKLTANVAYRIGQKK
jgi:hypothetical protein